MSGEPLQLSLFPDRAYLQRIMTEANQKQLNAMMAIPTLFGEWAVMRECGRIGSPGTVRTEFHEDEGQAVSALAEIARKKQRRGFEQPVRHAQSREGSARGC
jgi:predicted DNA-binding WGR domain protein